MPKLKQSNTLTPKTSGNTNVSPEPMKTTVITDGETHEDAETAKANAKVDADARRLREASEETQRNQRVAQRKANSLVAHTNATGDLTIERLSPALKQIEDITGAFIQHAAASGGGLVPEWFLGWDGSLVVVIGDPHLGDNYCGIWSAPKLEWITIDGVQTLQITIPPQKLGQGLSAIVACVSHSVVHLVNHKLEKRDVSRNGQHLDLFRDNAKAMLLEVVKVSTNVKYTTPRLSDEGEKWLERQAFDEGVFTVYAQEIEKATRGAAKAPGKSSLSDSQKAKKAKAAEKAKSAKSNSSKWEKFTAEFTATHCPVKAHRKGRKPVYVANVNLAEGKAPYQCGWVLGTKTTDKAISICQKALVDPAYEAPKTTKKTTKKAKA